MGRAEPDAEAAVWKAAGDARAWAAAIREHTAWTASVQGWSARIEADVAKRLVVEAMGKAARAKGPAGAKALGRAAEAMDIIVARTERAAKLVGRSSRFDRAAAAQHRRAARAYGRAAERGLSRQAARQAAASGRRAKAAARQSADLDRVAVEFGPFANTLAMAAVMPDAAESLRDSGAESASLLSGMLAAAGQECEESKAVVARAKKGERKTARAREAAARQSAAAAADAKAPAGSGPGARAAAAALKKAAAAADRAAADDEKIRQRDAVRAAEARGGWD